VDSPGRVIAKSYIFWSSGSKSHMSGVNICVMIDAHDSLLNGKNYVFYVASKLHRSLPSALITKANIMLEARFLWAVHLFPRASLIKTIRARAA